MYMRVLGVAIIPSFEHRAAWEPLDEYRDNPGSHCRDEIFNVSLPTYGRLPVVCYLRVGQLPGTESIRILLLGEKAALRDQKRVCRDTHGRVTVDPPPPSTFKVIESNLAFQFLVTPFDAPPHHHMMDQLTQTASFAKRRLPEFRGLGGTHRH
jgi:hypothetical protein